MSLKLRGESHKHIRSVRGFTLSVGSPLVGICEKRNVNGGSLWDGAKKQGLLLMRQPFGTCNPYWYRLPTPSAQAQNT